MKNLLLSLGLCLAACAPLDDDSPISTGSGRIVDNMSNDGPWSPQYLPNYCTVFGDHDIFLEVDQDWYATSISDDMIGMPVTLRLTNIRTTGPVKFTRWYKTETGQVVLLGTFTIEDSTCCESTFYTAYPGQDALIEVGMMVEGPEVGNDYEFTWSVTH